MTTPSHEWEARIEELLAPFSVKISLTPSQKAKLLRLAEDRKQTFDELINDAVVQLVEQNIGQATIKAPSWAQSKSKVVGYTGSVTRG